MTNTRADQAYAVTWLVRRVFRAMANRADQYLDESGLTAADRAVLEFLYMEGPLSVPEIARRFHVSRQHIQVSVNGLLEKKLLQSDANPRHKRSRLFRLSESGCRKFEAIRQNETQVIHQIFDPVSNAALDITKETLAAVLQQLKQRKD